MTHHNPNDKSLIPHDSPANDLVERIQPIDQRSTYRREIEEEARLRIAWMFDLKPIIGNVIAMVLIVAAIAVYRMDLGIFPDVGKWSKYIMILLACFAGFQLIKASLRSYLAPVIGAVFAAAGLIVAEQGDALLALPIEMYQWSALLSVIGFGCAAVSGRD